MTCSLSSLQLNDVLNDDGLMDDYRITYYYDQDLDGTHFSTSWVKAVVHARGFALCRSGAPPARPTRTRRVGCHAWIPVTMAVCFHHSGADLDLSTGSETVGPVRGHWLCRTGRRLSVV